jgi:hypothetical protein
VVCAIRAFPLSTYSGIYFWEKPGVLYQGGLLCGLIKKYGQLFG